MSTNQRAGCGEEPYRAVRDAKARGYRVLTTTFEAGRVRGGASPGYMRHLWWWVRPRFLIYKPSFLESNITPHNVSEKWMAY